MGRVVGIVGTPSDSHCRACLAGKHKGPGDRRLLHLISFCPPSHLFVTRGSRSPKSFKSASPIHIGSQAVPVMNKARTKRRGQTRLGGPVTTSFCVHLSQTSLERQPRRSDFRDGLLLHLHPRANLERGGTHHVRPKFLRCGQRV